MTTLIVPQRFCGPPVSGNGGYSSGALAALVEHDCPDDHADPWPTVEVSLLAPPPLDVEIPVSVDGELIVAATPTTRVATARVSHEALVPVAPVDAEEARVAAAAFPGWRSHAFPTCFVCGIDRAADDGLRIFPGPTSLGGEVFAATWTPHPSTSEDWHAYGEAQRLASVGVTWAALDCPGGWAGGFADRPMVLARMTARLSGLPAVGEPHVVVGEHRGTEGRKTTTASSLYDADGRLVGTSEQLWIAVDPALFS